MPHFLTSLRDRVADGITETKSLLGSPLLEAKSFPMAGTGGFSNYDGLQNAGFSRWLAGTQTDYAALAGDLWQNSAVAACLNWQITAFPEAPPCLKEKNNDGKLIVARDDLLGIADLLENPNGAYDDTVLWAGTLISFAVNGNAYWFIVRDRLGRIAELWYVPHFQVRPYWVGSDFITGYEYTVNGQRQKIPAADVIHFRFGVDPYNLRLGMAPLASITREVFTDVEATNYTASILKNMGVAGVIVSPKDSTVTELDPAAFTKLYKSKTIGDKRGEAMVLDSALNVVFPNNNPDRMALDVIRRYPEARICAVMGIPPQVVNLTVGLEHSSYSNMEQAQSAAWQNNLLPTQRILGRQATRQLLRQNYPAAKKFVIGFDTSQVRALQESADELHKRARADWQANLLTRAQALAEIGIDAQDADEGLYYADIAPPASGGFDKVVGDAVGAEIAKRTAGAGDAAPQE